MYQTMQLWVQEPMLHDAKLYLPALPQQYQAERLLQLFQNQKVGKQSVECTSNIYRWQTKDGEMIIFTVHYDYFS